MFFFLFQHLDSVCCVVIFCTNSLVVISVLIFAQRSCYFFGLCKIYFLLFFSFISSDFSFFDVKTFMILSRLCFGVHLFIRGRFDGRDSVKMIR